jgi:hypothetical protein
LAILLNFKNNVLPSSEVTSVAGEEYPVREHLFKRTEGYAEWCFLKGLKITKEMRLLRQKCREKEFSR